MCSRSGIRQSNFQPGWQAIKIATCWALDTPSRVLKAWFSQSPEHQDSERQSTIHDVPTWYLSRSLPVCRRRTRNDASDLRLQVLNLVFCNTSWLAGKGMKTAPALDYTHEYVRMQTDEVSNVWCPVHRSQTQWSVQGVNASFIVDQPPADSESL